MIQFLDEAGRGALRSSFLTSQKQCLISLMIMRTENLEQEQKKLTKQAQDTAAGIVALVKSEQQVRTCFWTNYLIDLFRCRPSFS